jgi:hypothetical protein
MLELPDHVGKTLREVTSKVSRKFERTGFGDTQCPLRRRTLRIGVDQKGPTSATEFGGEMYRCSGFARPAL